MGDEALVIEWVHDGIETLEEGQEAGEDEGKVGEVRLEWLQKSAWATKARRLEA